ncbi:MAG: hypothetical protein ABIR18_03260 [Chitinophagaceae bacterium]
MSLGKKILTLVLVGCFAMGAFATLGDGAGKKNSNKLLTGKTTVKQRSFSLRSGYNFRGNQVINQENRYVNLNTIVTFQKGHTTYTVPLQKKVVLNNKVVFNPNAASR